MRRDSFIQLAKVGVGEVDPEDVASVIFGQRLRFLVRIRQPLVLVTQMQRSGGTLITQMLDGHSRLHVHPSELHIGKPKWVWPEIDLSTPAHELFTLLREIRALEHARDGYDKLSPREFERNPDYDQMLLPFLFVEPLQRRLFVTLMGSYPPHSPRDVLDHYATSYFNAWLDYAGLYRPADYWVGFVPRLLIDLTNADRFFEDYPDGCLVVPVRDPVSWYASAHEHTREYKNLDDALDLWLQCNQNVLVAADAFPDRVLFVGFENLVEHPRSALTALLDRLGLQLEQANLGPTFNGMHIASDSSFGAKFELDRSVLDRTAQVSSEIGSIIRQRTRETYAELKARTEEPANRVRRRLARLRQR